MKAELRVPRLSLRLCKLFFIVFFLLAGSFLYYPSTYYQVSRTCVCKYVVYGTGTLVFLFRGPTCYHGSPTYTKMLNENTAAVRSDRCGEQERQQLSTGKHCTKLRCCLMHNCQNFAVLQNLFMVGVFVSQCSCS